MTKRTANIMSLCSMVLGFILLILDIYFNDRLPYFLIRKEFCFFDRSLLEFILVLTWISTIYFGFIIRSNKTNLVFGYKQLSYCIHIPFFIFILISISSLHPVPEYYRYILFFLVGIEISFIATVFVLYKDKI